MYVPKFLVEVPLLEGIVKGKRRAGKDGKYKIINPLSPTSFKLLLLSWTEQRIASEHISKLTKRPASLVLRQVRNELSSIVLDDEKLFEVSEIKPFGNQRRIDYRVHAQFRELFEEGKVRIEAEELYSTSNSTQIDTLVLMLSKRPQRVNYLDFLAFYLLGIPLSFLDTLNDNHAFSFSQRINRARERVLKACKLLNLNTSYELTRIPVGRYTARWFKVLEFK